MKATRECSIPGCGKPAKPGYRDPICPMHRERWRLHQSYDTSRPKPLRKLQPNGYWLIWAPDHPLVMPSTGYVLEHRAVLYARIGPGEHLCHWCGRRVAWETPFPRGLVVDHVDAVRTNNQIANLVPSCSACNVTRVARARPTCHAGHEYTVTNTRIGTDGKRRCRACQRAYQARKRLLT